MTSLLPRWSEVKDVVMDKHHQITLEKLRNLRTVQLEVCNERIIDKLEGEIKHGVSKGLHLVWDDYIKRHEKILNLARDMECSQKSMCDLYVGAGYVISDADTSENQNNESIIQEEEIQTESQDSAKPTSLEKLKIDVDSHFETHSPNFRGNLDKLVNTTMRFQLLHRRIHDVHAKVNSFQPDAISAALQSRIKKSANDPRVALTLALRDAINRLEEYYQSIRFYLCPLNKLDSGLEGWSEVGSEEKAHFERVRSMVMESIESLLEEEGSDIAGMSLYQLQSKGVLSRLKQLRIDKTRDTIRTQQELFQELVSGGFPPSDNKSGVRRQLRKSINELYVLEPKTRESIDNEFTSISHAEPIVNPIKEAARIRKNRMLDDSREVEKYKNDEATYLPPPIIHNSPVRVVDAEDVPRLSNPPPFPPSIFTSSIPELTSHVLVNGNRVPKDSKASSVMDRVLRQRKDPNRVRPQWISAQLEERGFLKQFNKRTRQEKKAEMFNEVDEDVDDGQSPSHILPTPISMHNVSEAKATREDELVEVECATSTMDGPSASAIPIKPKPKRYLTLFQPVFSKSDQLVSKVVEGEVNDPILLTSSPVTIQKHDIPDAEYLEPVTDNKWAADDDEPTERVVSKLYRRNESSGSKQQSKVSYSNSHTPIPWNSKGSVRSNSRDVLVQGKEQVKNVVIVAKDKGVSPETIVPSNGVTSSVESSDQGETHYLNFADATPIPMPIPMPIDPQKAENRKFMPYSQRQSLSPTVTSPDLPPERDEP
eukprot:GHVH01000663.1.p1 GENE.GHVH01000663.1~~GHVH01000663.1.p1  ORF type:complete len:767 (+),score=122.50 GHVH01000663.1:2280-4580(+)